MVTLEMRIKPAMRVEAGVRLQHQSGRTLGMKSVFRPQHFSPICNRRLVKGVVDVVTISRPGHFVSADVHLLSDCLWILIENFRSKQQCGFCLISDSPVKKQKTNQNRSYHLDCLCITEHGLDPEWCCSYTKTDRMVGQKSIKRFLTKSFFSRSSPIRYLVVISICAWIVYKYATRYSQNHSAQVFPIKTDFLFFCNIHK